MDYLKHITQAISQDPTVHPQFQFKDGLLWRDVKIFISKSSEIKDNLLGVISLFTSRGHARVTKT